MPEVQEKFRLLALDIATTTGWACWGEDDSAPTFGAVTFPDELAAFADGFENWLLPKIVIEGVTHLVIEASFPTKNTRWMTQLRLNWAQVNSLKVGYARSIPTTQIGAAEWRAYFIGVGRAPKLIPKNKRRAWLKQACIEQCIQQGWDVGQSDDTADALGLLSYALTLPGINKGVEACKLPQTVQSGTLNLSALSERVMSQIKPAKKSPTSCESGSASSSRRKRSTTRSTGSARKSARPMPKKQKSAPKPRKRELAG